MDVPIDPQSDAPISGPVRRTVKDDRSVESWRAHVYNRLNTQRRQIRVLKLFPNSDIRNDPEGELYTLDLIDVAAIATPHLQHGHLDHYGLGLASFAAISYAWGDTSIRRCMLLNGRLSEIGKNAHEALRYLRQAKKAIHIWIDTICINQADDRERSQQVPLMKDIYSLACPVYIWTGPGLKRSYKALGTITRMAEVMAKIKSEGDPNHSAKKRAIWAEMQKIADTDWVYLTAFVNLPIWRRVWVQQEIILSSLGRKLALVIAGKFELNHFTFVYGARAIWTSWHAFNGPTFANNPNATRAHMEEAVHATYALTHMNDQWNNYGSISPQSLISIMQSLEATDPKVRYSGALHPWLKYGAICVFSDCSPYPVVQHEREE